MLRFLFVKQFLKDLNEDIFQEKDSLLSWILWYQELLHEFLKVLHDCCWGTGSSFTITSSGSMNYSPNDLVVFVEFHYFLGIISGIITGVTNYY